MKKYQILNIKYQNYILKFRNFFLFAFLVVIFIFSFFILHLSKVHAQASRAFIVIPPKLELSAKPGETIQSSIRLQNQTENETTVFVGMSDFIVRDMSGTVELVDPEIAGEWALSQWLSLNTDTLTIPPGEQGAVSLTISVPEDALPGGRYASVYFSESGLIEKGQTGTGVTTEIRSLVLLRIEGPITEEAIVRRFEIPRFSEYGPVTIVTELANLGNYHIAPIGAISIKNMLGKTLEIIDLEERNIFPGASQEYINEWGQKWLFGRYQATLTGAYGEQNLPLTATIFFWVWPWKITLAVIGIIILIILLILLLKSFKKRQEMKPEEIEEEELEEETEEEE